MRGVIAIALVLAFFGCGDRNHGPACKKLDRWSEKMLNPEFTDEEMLLSVTEFCDSMGFPGDGIDKCTSPLIAEWRASDFTGATLRLNVEMNARAANDCRSRGMRKGSDTLQRCVISRVAELDEQFADRMGHLLERCQDENDRWW